MVVLNQRWNDIPCYLVRAYVCEKNGKCTNTQAPFHEHTNKRRLVDYLELRSLLRRVVRRSQNEFWLTQQNGSVQTCIDHIP